MCKIRVFFKSDQDNIQRDFEMEFERIDMNLIDRPSYVEVVSSGDNIDIRFAYYNDQEQYRIFNYSGLNFEYAILSGRIRQVRGKTIHLYETDKFQILNGFFSLGNQRFKVNSSAYLSIVMKLLNEKSKYMKKN